MSDNEHSSLYNSLTRFEKEKDISEELLEQVRSETIQKSSHTIQLSHNKKTFSLKLPIMIMRGDGAEVFALSKEEERVSFTEDMTVSRAKGDRPGHAAILTLEGNVVIQDLGSKNGTIVKDVTLEKDDQIILKIGDSFKIGNNVFLVTDILSEIQAILIDNEQRQKFCVIYSILLDKIVKQDDAADFTSKLKLFCDWNQDHISERIYSKLTKFIEENLTYNTETLDDYIREKWENEIKPIFLVM